MANVFNKTTGQYKISVHTPDFMDADHIINPDVSALENVPRRYWKFDGFDGVTEMTQVEKDAVDNAILAERRVRMKAAAEQEFNSSPTFLAITKLMFREFNKLRVKNGDLAYTAKQFNDALQAELDKSV